jgi:hypothetical protein
MSSFQLHNEVEPHVSLVQRLQKKTHYSNLKLTLLSPVRSQTKLYDFYIHANIYVYFPATIHHLNGKLCISYSLSATKPNLPVDPAF